MLSPEHEAMLELLKYPNPIGLYDSVARWRDFARELVREHEAELERLREQIRDAEFNNFRV